MILKYFFSHDFFCVFREKFQNQISQQQQQQQQPQQKQTQSPIHANNNSNTNTLNRRNIEVKKKVWSVDAHEQQQQPAPVVQQIPPFQNNGNTHPTSAFIQQPTNGIDVSIRILLNFNKLFVFSIDKPI